MMLWTGDNWINLAAKARVESIEIQAWPFASYQLQGNTYANTLAVTISLRQ